MNVSRRGAIVVILVVIGVLGFGIIAGTETSMFDVSTGIQLKIDKSAVARMKSRGNEFYVRPGRAG